MQSSDEEARGMNPIDLSLAVNYLPAVGCLLKSLILISILATVKVQYVFSTFSILAMVLNVDKVVTSERIFNGNAVLYAILVSWALNYLRTTMQPAPAFNFVISFFWSILSVAMLMELRSLHSFLVAHYATDPDSCNMRRSNTGYRGLKRIVPTALNMLFMGSISFIYTEDEPASIKIARSLAFCLLCIAWVYTVGVWQRCAAPMLGIFTQNMLTRFYPVLFLNAYCALVFTATCIMGLVGLYVEMHGGGVGWVKRLSSGMPVDKSSERAGLCERGEAVSGCSEFEGTNDTNASSMGLSLSADYSLLASASQPYTRDFQSECDKEFARIDTIQEEESEEDIEAYFRSACREHMAMAK